MKLRILSILLMIMGIALFSYPFISFTVNDIKKVDESNAVISYIEGVSKDYKNKALKKSKKYTNKLNEYGTKIEDPFYIDNVKTAKDNRDKMAEKDIFFDDETIDDIEKDYNKSDEGFKNKLNSPRYREFYKDGVIGYIIIPKIGVKNIIYCDTSDEHLLKGVGCVRGTDLPYGGINTRSIIAGHRGTYRISMMFRHLDRLEKGDDIFVYNLEGRLHYKVDNSEVILPSDSDKLLPKEGHDILSLITCDPFPTGKRRLVINSYRVDEKDSLPISVKIQGDIGIEEGFHTKTIRMINHLISILSILVMIFLLIKIGLIIKKEKDNKNLSN